MANAYICDHCGQYVKGLPPEEPVPVGHLDAEVRIGVVVWQHPAEGKKFRPQLCKGCTVTAVLAVARDLEKGGEDAG